MKQLLAGAGLALAACNVAWAHDGVNDAKPHTHWWLQMSEEKASWYAGAALGYASFTDWSLADEANDGSYTSADSDDADTGFRVHLGLDFLEYFAVELGYADYGEATFSGQSDGSGAIWAAGPIREAVAAAGPDLALLAHWKATPDLRLAGRVGVLKWDVDSEISGDIQGFGPLDIAESDDGADLLIGLGIDYDGLRPLRLSLGYTRARLNVRTTAHDDFTLGSIALAASYVFE